MMVRQPWDQQDLGDMQGAYKLPPGATHLLVLPVQLEQFKQSLSQTVSLSVHFSLVSGYRVKTVLLVTLTDDLRRDVDRGNTDLLFLLDLLVAMVLF